MPLVLKPGAKRPEPQRISAVLPRRCLGIITPQALEGLRTKSLVTEAEYEYLKRMFNDVETRRKDRV